MLRGEVRRPGRRDDTRSAAVRSRVGAVEGFTRNEPIHVNIRRRGSGGSRSRRRGRTRTPTAQSRRRRIPICVDIQRLQGVSGRIVTLPSTGPVRVRHPRYSPWTRCSSHRHSYPGCLPALSLADPGRPPSATAPAPRSNRRSHFAAQLQCWHSLLTAFRSTRASIAVTTTSTVTNATSNKTATRIKPSDGFAGRGGRVVRALRIISTYTPTVERRRHAEPHVFESPIIKGETLLCYVNALAIHSL